MEKNSERNYDEEHMNMNKCILMKSIYHNIEGNNRNKNRKWEENCNNKNYGNNNKKKQKNNNRIIRKGILQENDRSPIGKAFEIIEKYFFVE